MASPLACCLSWVRSIPSFDFLTEWRLATSSRWNGGLRREAWYVVPRDAIRIRTNDARILELADRLWDRVRPGLRSTGRTEVPIAFAIDVQGESDGARPSAALTERWGVGTDHAELSLGDHLWARIDCAAGYLIGRVSARLVTHEFSLVARLLLETPAAALLARRGYCVLHAGAVSGPVGAVVIRGAAGAGKSTLVAAAYRSGLGVLGDESVLAARSDPDDILSAVRDVTLRPDAARLLALEDAATAAGSGADAKYRLDLFPSSTPAVRRARRVATVLLGPRNGSRARLEPLAPDTFLEDFRHGAIPQEHRFGTPDHIAAHWSRSGGYRLSGAADLTGAVGLLTDLVSRPGAARPR